MRTARTVIVLAAALLWLVSPAVPAAADPGGPPPGPRLDGEQSPPAGSAHPSSDDDPGQHQTVTTVAAAASYFFDTRSLFDLLNRTLSGILTRSTAEILPQWRQPLHFALQFPLAYSADGLSRVPGPQGEVDLAARIYPYWRTSLGVAAAFFPLVLIASIAQVYTSGSSAPVARAEMLQSLVASLLRFALVASSWWACNLVVKISWGLAEQAAAIGTGPDGSEIAARLAGLILQAALTGLLKPGLALLFFYLLLFAFFLTLSLVTALLLSHYAFLALTAVFIVLAPVVMAVGALPFFHWLYATWLKMVSGILMLPLANVLILKLAFAILPLEGGGAVVRLFTALGVVGLLVTVNYSVARAVFAPVGQAARTAGQAVLGLGKLAGSAIALAAGGVSLASASAAMLGPGRGPAPAGPDGTAGVSPGAEPAPPAPGRLETLRQRAAQGTLGQGEFGRVQAEWQTAKQAAQFSLLARDPLLRGALSAFQSAHTGPVDAGLAEIGGLLRDQRQGSAAPPAESSQVPWPQARLNQLVRPANPAQAEAMYGWAREAFASPGGAFYPELRARLGDPAFTPHFEGLVAGAAALHADVPRLVGGASQQAWEVPGLDRRQALEAVARAGAFFGGEVEAFATAVAARDAAGEAHLGDYTDRSLHRYIQGVLARFRRE